jgi:hypothetical protein
MIALSAPTFDPLGHIIIDDLPSSDLGGIRRRGSRVATLGPEGSVAQDRGYFVADRTFLVDWRVTSESQYRSVRRMVELYSRLMVSTPEGMFKVWPQGVTLGDDGEAGLELMVLEKIS